MPAHAPAMAARPLLSGARAVLGLALPLVGGNIAQFAIHLTDTVTLGRHGTLSLAAGTLGAATFFLAFILGSGFAGAVMTLGAEAAARGDRAGLRRITRMGLWLSTVYAGALLPLGLAAPTLLRLLGQDPAVADAAGRYLAITVLGLGPALWLMVLRATLIALGQSRAVLVVTVAAAVANAGLDWLLIFGHAGLPELGVAGAAVASVGVQVIALVLAVVHFSRSPELRSLRLMRRLWRIDIEVAARVLCLGWPIGVVGLVEAGLFSATSVMMGWIGPATLAAHGIALELASLAFMIHLGVSHALTALVARARAAQDAPALRRFILAGGAVSALIVLVTVLAFVCVPDRLVSLFLARDRPGAEAIRAVAEPLLQVAAVFQAADAAQVLLQGVLRGLQDTRLPLLLTIVGFWGIGIPAGWHFGLAAGLGGPGVWLGLVAGLIAGALLLTMRLRYLLRALAPPAEHGPHC